MESFDGFLVQLAVERSFTIEKRIEIGRWLAKMQISVHDFREKRGKRVGCEGCKVDRCQIAKDRLRTRDISSPGSPTQYILSAFR